MKRVLVVIAPLVLAFLCASVAFAGGGNTIVSAPELPIGSQITGGGTGANGTPQMDGGWQDCCYGEFWRITLIQADHLRIDYGNLAPTSDVELCLIDPNATDYTVVQTGCIARSETQSKVEFSYVAPKSGRYTVYLYNNCGACGGGGPLLNYEMTAYVQHYTYTTISAPRLLKANSRVTYTGSVSGIASGQVELQSRSLKHPAWKTFALVNLKGNGSFSYSTKVAEPGTYRIHAVFPGDDSHLPSAATVSFKVIKVRR